MSVPFERGSKEFQMFGDYYNIVKAFWKVENSFEYHCKLTAALNEFIKKYGVDRVTNSQKDPVASMAQRLAIAMTDHVGDVLGRGKR